MNNIVLIGFMGSGKTSVSKALAKKARMNLIDTDAMVEKKARLKIKKIFADKGEPHFRALEAAAAKKAAKLKNTVIATGGGIVKKPANVMALSKSGVVVYLKNSFETSRRRLAGKKDRPLFNHDNLAAARALFRQRQKLYRAAADAVVVTDKKNVAAVVAEILKKTGRN